MEKAVLALVATPHREEVLEVEHRIRKETHPRRPLQPHHEALHSAGLLPDPSRPDWRYFQRLNCGLCQNALQFNPADLYRNIPARRRQFRPEDLKSLRALLRPGQPHYEGLPWDWVPCPRCQATGREVRVQETPYDYLTLDRVGSMDPAVRETAHQVALELAHHMDYKTDWVAWGSGWAEPPGSRYGRELRVSDVWRDLLPDSDLQLKTYPTWNWVGERNLYEEPELYLGVLLDRLDSAQPERAVRVRQLLDWGVDPFNTYQGHLCLTVPYPLSA